MFRNPLFGGSAISINHPHLQHLRIILPPLKKFVPLANVSPIAAIANTVAVSKK
jgi:hypothetical protein